MIEDKEAFKKALDKDISAILAKLAGRSPDGDDDEDEKFYKKVFASQEFYSKTDEGYEEKCEELLRSMIHDMLASEFCTANVVEGTHVVGKEELFGEKYLITCESKRHEIVSTAGFTDKKEACYWASKIAYTYKIEKRNMRFACLMKINELGYTTKKQINEAELMSIGDDEIEQARLDYLKWRI